MSESFDPYYKWLGIKPKDQPPNHYRLLGVELYESDADVIENAADQRMRHMRTLHSGPNAEASQRILNEVAAARVCLTDPIKRAEYDRQLKAALDPRLAAPPYPAAPPPAPPVGRAAAPPVAATPRMRTAAGTAAELPFATAIKAPRHRASPRRPSGFPLALVASGAGLIALLVLAMVLMSVLKKRPETLGRPEDNPVESRTPPTPPPPRTTKSPDEWIVRPPTSNGGRPTPERPKPTGDLRLMEIPTITLGQGEKLRVQAQLQDPERWKGQVRFAAGLGVPAETKVDVQSGWIEWTPPKEARRTYLFNIEARAGIEEATASFQVDLPWARGDLVFARPGDQTAYPGEPLVVPLAARDDVGQVEGAKFEIVDGPQGAAIDPATGQFRWQAAEDQIDTRRRVSVRVTDARGVSATNSFTIRVKKKPPPEEMENSAGKSDQNNSDNRPRRGNLLRFEGNGHVATEWRYDGSMPLTLEVIAIPFELRRCAVLGCLHLSGVAVGMTSEGKWSFVVQDKEGSRQIVSDEPARPNQSSHVAGVLADGKLSLFVNGQLQKETAEVKQFVPSRHALLIGADTNGEGHPEAYFRGAIRTVRASNTVRYRDSFQRPFRLNREDGSTLHLEFNQGAGNEVQDRSGKNPPAKIHGAVWGTR